MCLLTEAWEGFMRFSVRGYLSSALLGALLVAQSLALLVPTIAGGKGGVPPPSPGLPVLSSVSFTPAIVPGGSPATGTVKFGSVTDGAVVTLFNSNPAVVTVPAETVVNGGQSSGAFPVTTTSVTATTVVTIMATAFGVNRMATITVTPDRKSTRLNSSHRCI